jgi:hypothetical protein
MARTRGTQAVFRAGWTWLSPSPLWSAIGRWAMESVNALEISRSLAATSSGRRTARLVNDRQVCIAISVVCAVLCLAGCGGNSAVGIPPSVVTNILSNPRFDGDIEQTSATSFTVTQGMSATVQSVLAGIDPTARTEFRAFLNFPLGGSGGVPANAIIDSAFLEVLVDNVIPRNGSVPIRVELVAFQPPTLIGTDFDRTALPPLGAVLISGPVTAADIGHFVPVDVTSLMIQAQHRGLVDFQVRIMEDLGPASFTLIVIDDAITADRPRRAPLLTVTYH